ncbi:Proteasome activator complex subunit 3 [Blomia tropicalis]|nr:Proteasome activator complex subunit 3 [Blomia tropicalis]
MGKSENMFPCKKAKLGKGKSRTTQSLHRLRGTRMIRLNCPMQITTIKHRLVYDAFRTLFEQFPHKIGELKKLLNDVQYRMERGKDIITDNGIFNVPPSLRQLEREQQQQQQQQQPKHEHSNMSTKMCNCNRQWQVYLNYDGYIKANQHLVQFVSQLESFYDFYTNWWNQFYYAVLLMKPQIQEENNLESEIQDSTFSFLSDIHSKINAFTDSVDICLDRFSMILKIQQFPHILDYRKDLAIFERETWFELYLTLKAFYSHFVLTYDCVAKNYDKLL